MYEKLKEELAVRNISKRKLALMAGITPQGLYGAINGHCEFWPNWRRKVASVLDMEEHELFGESYSNRKRLMLAMKAMDNFESRFGGIKEFESVIAEMHKAKSEVENELENTVG